MRRAPAQALATAAGGRSDGPVLASILNLATNVGYPSVFLLVMAESAGIPLPGKTAPGTGALLGSRHELQIPVVIASAASAAIIGDNLGSLIGRKGGRWLLERPGPFAASRRQALNAGIPFFERRGKRAVFSGRWLIGLRTWASRASGRRRVLDQRRPTERRSTP